MTQLLAQPSPTSARYSFSRQLVPQDVVRPGQGLVYATPIAGLSAMGLGVSGLFGFGPSFLARRPLVSAILACGGIALLVKSQLQRWWLESPAYQVVATHDEFEVREYRPRIVAETVVMTSSFEEARIEGFRRLAAYIYGDNIPSEHFWMTMPLTVDRTRGGDSGERVPMTTPVTVARSRSGYVVRFQMPRSQNLSELPTPLDSAVQVRKIGGERVAVQSFRDRFDAVRVRDHQQRLVEAIREHGIAVAGEPIFAGYDSPATLPLLRRSELWVPVARV